MPSAGQWETLVDEALLLGLQQIREEIVECLRFLSRRPIRNVLEIGSASGASFFLWCQLAERSGKKISVDLPGGAYGGEPNADPRTLIARNHRIRSWGEQVYMVSGDSKSDHVRNEVARILNGDQVDLLFIDGDHTFDGVSLDYSRYSKFVRPSGCVLFHDINDSEWHRSQNVGVAQLWQSLPGHKIEFNSGQSWGGLGLLLV